ncbi:MAG: PAS domain-containing protein [Microcoleus sp.]
MCPSLDDDRSEDDRTLLSLRDRQLRTVFEMALDAIAIADDEGRYLDVNPAACELFGLEKDELLGCCISDFTEPGFNFQQVWQEFQQPEQDLRSLTKETGFFLRKDALQPADSVKNPVSGAPCVSATEKLRGEFQLVRPDGEIRVVEYAATANFLPHRHLSIMRDITERKRAEIKVQELTRQLEQTQAQLREAGLEPVSPATPTEDHRLKQIASHIPGIIYQFRMRPDGTSHFPYSSERLREISGVSPEEVREDAAKIFSVIHPDDLDRVSQSILDSAEHLTPWYCEYQVCLPDGRLLWLLGNSTPQRKPDGSTIWHGYIRDITDSKTTELALRTSENKFRSIIENLNDMVYIINSDATFSYVSPQFKDVMGYELAELLDDSFAKWVNPEDLPICVDALHRSFQGEKVRGIEYRVLHQDGNYYWHSSNVSALRNDDGQVVSCLGIARYIHEQKQAEIALQESNNRWKLAIESAGDGTWDWNIKTNEAIFSRQWKAMLGYAEHEIANALEEWDIRVHPEDKARCYELVTKHLNGETSTYDNEHRLRCKDGSYKWILARAQVIERDKEGQPLRLIGTHSDISDRKAAEIAQQELTRQLEEAQRVARIGNWSFDLATQKITWSAELFRIFGMHPSQGEPEFDDHIKQYHPDDRELFVSCVKAAGDQGIPQNFDIRIFGSDGAIHYINSRIEIEQQNGKNFRLFGTAMDITDRKQAETQLNEISERLSLSLKSGAMGCWEWDIVDNTLVWDDRMYELYGITKNSDSRLAYEIWSQVLHPDDRNASETLIRQTVLGQAEFDPEFRVVHPDGSIHFIKAFGIVRRDAEGNPQKMIGVNFDISDRKQAEILLQQSQKRYQTLAEASPIGVFLTDAKGDCLYVNQTWLQTTGLTREEALGPDWAQTLHPEDRERIFKEWYESALVKQQFQSEYRFLRPDSSVAWVIGQALPLIDSEGEIEGYVGTITDISDRKRQEQALRLIVEGTAAKTGADFFKSCVQYLAQVLGVRYAFIAEFVNPEKSIAKTLAFWAGDDFGDNFTYSLIGSPCEKSQTEFCLYPNSVQSLFPEDDDLVALQAESYAGLPIIDAAGNHLGLLAVLDTKPMEKDREMQSAILKIFATRAGAEMDRIQAEAVRQSEIQLRLQSEKLAATLKKLQNTQTQLIQAEKMSSLGQLVAGIAHEINNPISFIYGNIQPATNYVNDLIELIRLYQKHAPSPPQAISDFTEDIDFEYLVSDFSKLLKSMKTGATRIRDIVKSLRTFSRLDEAGLKEIDLHENIESTLVILQNRLHGRAGEPEIHLTKNYGKLPLVECYCGLLNQVFLNLLINAIDAIEQRRLSLGTRQCRVPTEELDYIGGITITTSITSENQVIVSIQDNGCGMNSEVQEQIFNPFFTTKPVGKGTGMGLATSYQIVTENHRGNLRCFSTPGEGTKFAIELPISHLELG